MPAAINERGNSLERPNLPLGHARFTLEFFNQSGKTKYGACPIFVTYHKSEEVESSVACRGELINQEPLRWFTRSNRTLQSDEVRKIIHSEELGIDIRIIVKKDDY